MWQKAARLDSTDYKRNILCNRKLLSLLDSEYDHTWREELQKLQLELSELDLQVFQISEKVNLFFGNLRKGY